jgi:hypothetical protein
MALEPVTPSHLAATAGPREPPQAPRLSYHWFPTRRSMDITIGTSRCYIPLHIEITASRTKIILF